MPAAGQRSIRVAVDEARCVGAGNCAAVAPEVFDQSEHDGVVILLQDEPPPEERGRVEEAAEVCPVAAIKVVDF